MPIKFYQIELKQKELIMIKLIFYNIKISYYIKEIFEDLQLNKNFKRNKKK